MSLTVKRYTPDLGPRYERLLKESSVAMFNHSLRYRDFLKEIMTDSEDHYLCAFCNDQLVAVLPTFIKRGPYGAVVNSLPFYGSHGGIVYYDKIDPTVVNTLFDDLERLCQEVEAFSCTVIESPWEKNKEIYKAFNANLFDERIGQITLLPPSAKSHVVENSLFALYHQKTRNMVRKGLKGGFQVSHDGSNETIRILHAIHDENIRGMGGIAKPLSVFETIQKVFRYDEDYRIYTARKDNKIVSALLIFYFKDTVEYFTPATLESYRSEQPLSLLIYTAMRDSILERDSQFWNWGGTWLSQTGVYQFKARWGTKDHPYKYHTKTWKKPSFFENKGKSNLLKKYPFTYVIPF